MSTTPEQLAVELEDLANICAQDRWLSVADYVDDLRAAAAMIRAAAARLDELERENAALQKERDYAVKWGNASVESVQEAMWRYQDALHAVFARLDDPGNADQRVQYFLRWPEVKEARAALAGSGEK
jgi:hypothetical protein